MPNHWIAVATAALSGLLAFFLLPIVWTLLIGAAAGASAWFFLRSKAGGEAANAPQPDAIPAHEQATEALLDANLSLRRAICPAAVVTRYEDLIDQLLDLVPSVNQEAANTELAWVINQMSLDYLPQKSLAPYLGLDRDARHATGTIEQVMAGLDAMATELNEVRDLIGQHRTDEFDRKAEFLKRRFQ